MKSILRSVRIAPKKANLVARMVRGLSVPEATEQLRLTNKKAARLIENLLRSAVANASHNDRQDPQTMIVKTVVVNQGTAYRRGMPKARGQMRPYRKFLSHITLELGYPGDEATVSKTSSKKKAATPSKTAPVSETPAPKKKSAAPAKRSTPKKAS